MDSSENLRENDYALVIGINDYPSKENGGLLPTLKGAIADAQAMAEWLTDKRGGRIPLSNCETLYSSMDCSTPLLEMIDKKLENIFDNVWAKGGEADRFYFYFSGHGFGSEINQSDIALCLTNWSLKRKRSAISSFEYYDLFIRFKIFGEVIFWTDCCRNTSYRIRPFGSTLDVFRIGSIDTVYMIGFATQYMDQAYEVGIGANNESRGIFSQLLLKGLNGEATTENGAINAHSLKSYLDIHVPIAAQEHGYKQKPQIMITGDADSILFREGISPNKEKCFISISPEQAGEIEILNGNLQCILRSIINEEKIIEIDLVVGIYIVQNPTKNSRCLFEVTKEKGANHVNF